MSVVLLVNSIANVPIGSKRVKSHRNEAMKNLVLLFSLLIIAIPSSAEIYKWVDEEGQIHFSDKKPENLPSTEIEVEISTYQSVSYGISVVDTSKVAAGSKVVIFSARWCGICKTAKQYFKKNKIRYKDYDIERNSKGKRLYKQLGAKGVPVILVGKKRMNGFSESAFENLIR